MAAKKLATNILSSLLTAALLIFAHRYITGLLDKAALSEANINWVLVALSMAAFVLFYTLLSIHWLLACRYIQRDAAPSQRLAFFASQPYKYLPTSLFTFSFRAVYAKKLGLSLKQSSLAQLVENISMFASNFVLFGVLYVAAMAPWGGLMVGLLAGIVALASYIRVKDFTIKIYGRSLNIRVAELLGMGLIAVAAWTVSGFAFALLNYALGLEIDLLKMLAANTIAFSLGLLAFFAPGGIGVREIVYGAFSINPAVIILWRIQTFVLDFVLGTVAILLIRRKNKT